MTKIAINGFGRIGRAVFKITFGHPELEVVALNDLVPPDNLAYLLKYDTVYGRYDKAVDSTDHSLIVNDREYPVYNLKDPSQLPWEKLGVDIAIESTGVFTKAEDLKKHLEAGAKYVILSAPVKGDGIGTVVHGVGKPGEGERILSCASCTTNAITPPMEIMQRRIGVKKALMTTVLAYTSSQQLVDLPSKKFRRGRAAAANFVPTSTGAAIATTKALPELDGQVRWSSHSRSGNGWVHCGYRLRCQATDLHRRDQPDLSGRGAERSLYRHRGSQRGPSGLFRYHPGFPRRDHRSGTYSGDRRRSGQDHELV